MKDIRVGDLVRFSYFKDRVQILAPGQVIQELPDGKVLVRITSGRQAEVPLSHIVDRQARPEQKKIPVYTPKDPEEELNNGVIGVRFKRRQHGSKENKSRD